jgi:hypothetical protein
MAGTYSVFCTQVCKFPFLLLMDSHPPGIVCRSGQPGLADPWSQPAEGGPRQSVFTPYPS